MRLMKYSSPSCHSSRSLAPYIIQEGEGGCIEGRGTERGPRGEGGRRKDEGFHRGNCEDSVSERGGDGRTVTPVGRWAPVGSVGVPQGLRTRPRRSGE